MKIYIRTLAKQQFALQLQLIMKTTEQCKKNILSEQLMNQNNIIHH